MEDLIAKPIRIVIIDDHDLVRQALTDRLGSFVDIAIEGSAGTVAGGLELVMTSMPDIALLDVSLPDGNGIALCKSIRAMCPATQCILHTSVEIGPETAEVAGAAAIVLKELLNDRLVETIRAVHHGTLGP